jgi:hypothetical protein
MHNLESKFRRFAPRDGLRGIDAQARSLSL